MYINKKLIIVFSILFIIILFYKNKENLTFDEIVKKREKENKKKKFDIIVNIPDLHKNYIHIKGFGSQTLTNIYKVDYNNDINQRK